MKNFLVSVFGMPKDGRIEMHQYDGCECKIKSLEFWIENTPVSGELEGNGLVMEASGTFVMDNKILKMNMQI